MTKYQKLPTQTNAVRRMTTLDFADRLRVDEKMVKSSSKTWNMVYADPQCPERRHTATCYRRSWMTSSRTALDYPKKIAHVFVSYFAVGNDAKNKLKCKKPCSMQPCSICDMTNGEPSNACAQSAPIRLLGRKAQTVPTRDRMLQTMMRK